MQAIREFSLGSSGRALVVIGLHVAVVYFIATSLRIVPPLTLSAPMEAVMIETQQPTQPVEPVVVKPEFAEPTLDVPEPDAVPIPEVEVPTDVPASNAISAMASDAVESTELQVVNRVTPAYPPASRRLGEAGTVVFRVLVDENGHPLQVEVTKSSGFTRLDDAALQAIRRWIFVSPTRAGQPVRSWSRVQVRFRLDT